ncbi:MAG TPA: DUF6600 domain-containing protein [Chitinophagaceae bacterium]
MKCIVKIILVLILCSVLITTPHRLRAQEFWISLQVFYDQLSPYGQWVDYPQYGYAWIPSLDETFMPYATDGHWVLTDYGWTWLSDYDWGWAAFHYGRWYYDPYYGWIWMPDTMWAPAWVAWRESSGYYGWAPLAPGVNVSANFTNYDIPAQQWVFVRSDDIVRSDINHYYINRTENETIIKNTAIIKNTYIDRSRNITYIAGPDKNEVQKITGKPIKPVPIEETRKPEQKVNNDKFVIYRPQVKKEDNSNKVPAPAKIVALKDVKKSAPQKEIAPAGNNQAIQQQQKNNQGLNRLDSGNKKVIQQARKSENTNPTNKPDQQQEKKAQKINPVNKQNQQQVKPKPNPQNMPQQKPKPKTVPPKPQPPKPQPDTARRPH